MRQHEFIHLMIYPSIWNWHSLNANVLYAIFFPPIERTGARKMYRNSSSYFIRQVHLYGCGGKKTFVYSLIDSFLFSLTGGTIRVVGAHYFWSMMLVYLFRSLLTAHPTHDSIFVLLSKLKWEFMSFKMRLICSNAP